MTPAKKPEKPRSDFPLFPHATKRWAKKIRGKLHYFGPWDDPAGAEQKYLDQRDYLQAGRKPPVVDPDALTVQKLGNAFLNAKRKFVDAGELSIRTWQEYYFAVVRLCDAFGKGRAVDDLTPQDFEGLRATMAKTLGAVSLGNEIQRVRTLFKYGFESGLMPKPMLFGPLFRKPSRKTMRKAKNDSGTRVMEAADVRSLIEAAEPVMKAMLLLAMNCGFGQGDLSALKVSAFDEPGWCNHPRPKTAIPRRCPLWPETIEAVKDAIAVRPKPRNGTDPDLVFVTKYGNAWVRFDTGDDGDKRTNNDSIGRAFAKLATEHGLKERGSFYRLRHTFRTIADEAKDQPACDALMGHSDESMAGRYRDRNKISDDRLRAVVNTVRAWLNSETTKR